MDILSKYVNEINWEVIILTSFKIFLILLVAWIGMFVIQKVLKKLESRLLDKSKKEGEPPSAFCCLVSGRLQAYITKENGERENVEFIKWGMYFGIISLLTGDNHSLTFEAINDSVVLRIEKDDFKEILKQIPRLGVTLSHSLSRRMKNRQLHFPV